MTELSPAARAVLDAHISHWTADPYEISPEALAAALRAAVEHLGYELELDDLSGTVLSVVSISSLLAIADELETQ